MGRSTGRTAALIIACALIVACSDSSALERRTSPTPGASALAPRSPRTVASLDPLADLAHGPFPTGCVDQRYTTPLLDAKTDGRRLIWSSGAHEAAPDTAPDLVVWEPGSAAAPQVVFSNPNRDSNVFNFVGNGGSIAFVEQNPRRYGEAGWRLWLLRAEHPTPLAIDASEEVVGTPPPPLPFPTLNGSDLVWSTVHRVAGRLRYELLDYSIVTGRRRVLASASVTATEYWFPSLAADGALVYGTVEHHAARLAFHVYLTNLAGARPTRLDPSGEVAAPAFNGSVVLWKRIAQNVFEPGNLERYDLATRSVTPIWFGRQLGVNYPSVGDRYGAVWGNDATDFEIVDLARAQPVLVQRWSETYPYGVVRPQIAGDLMAYLVGPDDPRGHLWLCWARLPG
ncbi:MAG: hypothetical protein ACP5VP_03930 [Candidatus Limnocylindrales bacterium]